MCYPLAKGFLFDPHVLAESDTRQLPSPDEVVDITLLDRESFRNILDLEQTLRLGGEGLGRFP